MPSDTEALREVTSSLAETRETMVRAVTQLEGVAHALTKFDQRITAVETLIAESLIDRVAAAESAVANIKWILGIIIPLALGGGAAAGVML